MNDLLELRNQFGQQLTTEQQEHIEGIITRFAIRAYKKYADGEHEHGGDLWKKAIILPELINETIDQVVYADTLEQQIRESGVQLGNPELAD
jgi:hypothetical protein